MGLRLSWLCLFAGVSKSGYYKWRCNKDNKARCDTVTVLLIRDIANKHNNKIGVRRICMELRTSGIIMNPKKVLRIKREYGIPTKIRKKRSYNIVFRKDLSHRVAPNLLNQRFNVLKPDTVYCTDITYLFYDGGIGYLSSTKDIATKEIVAYNISGNMGINTGLESISALLRSRDMGSLMIHSDQGVHYTHPAYVGLLSKHGVVQSMSRKGVCLDNAPIESFFGHMKDEIDIRKCRNLEELRTTIDNYIKYYNTERCQWDLKKMPPAKYREHLLSLLI